MKSSDIPPLDVTGYMPVDEFFVKDLDKEKVFMTVAENDNQNFGIKKGAYILCEVRPAKEGELVIDREPVGLHQGIYKVMRLVKSDGFCYLENSKGKKIVRPDYQNFGVLLKIFNISN